MTLRTYIKAEKELFQKLIDKGYNLTHLIIVNKVEYVQKNATTFYGKWEKNIRTFTPDEYDFVCENLAAWVFKRKPILYYGDTDEPKGE